MSKTVLFELGVEELPARFIDDAIGQLKEKTIAWLEENRIPYGAVKDFATPRRLAVQITDVAEKQPDVEEEAKGPAKKIALDEEGNWTKAAIGFSKGQGKVSMTSTSKKSAERNMSMSTSISRARKLSNC